MLLAQFKSFLLEFRSDLSVRFVELLSVCQMRFWVLLQEKQVFEAQLTHLKELGQVFVAELYKVWLWELGIGYVAEQLLKGLQVSGLDKRL